MINKLVIVRNFLIFKWFTTLAWLSRTKFKVSQNANFVVSIASYPKRDHLLPAIFQALSKQIVIPNKWILVLSVEDYPSGLPDHLQKLESRGIEILWVRDNPYSVKKLIPVIEKYPKSAVVTLDDDIIYHPSLLEGLVDKVDDNRDSIVGYIGKAMVQKGGEIEMLFREPKPADIATKSDQVYLIGWGGVYYPPGSLDLRVLEMNAVHRIVPGRGSDIWFWAAAHAKGTKQLCVGPPEGINLGIPIPQTIKTQPKDTPGKDILLERFQMAIDHFGIREKLLKTLPDIG